MSKLLLTLLTICEKKKKIPKWKKKYKHKHNYHRHRHLLVSPRSNFRGTQRKLAQPGASSHNKKEIQCSRTRNIHKHAPHGGFDWSNSRKHTKILSYLNQANWHSEILVLSRRTKMADPTQNVDGDVLLQDVSINDSIYYWFVDRQHILW